MTLLNLQQRWELPNLVITTILPYLYLEDKRAYLDHQKCPLSPAEEGSIIQDLIDPILGRLDWVKSSYLYILGPPTLSNYLYLAGYDGDVWWGCQDLIVDRGWLLTRARIVNPWLYPRFLALNYPYHL